MTTSTQTPRSESARPCGCDRGADHLCAAHESARDLSITVIGPEQNITMTGPSAFGLFDIRDLSSGGDGDLVILTRGEAEDLIAELQRRLNLRGSDGQK